VKGKPSSEFVRISHFEKTLPHESVPWGFAVYSHSADVPERSTTPLSTNLER